MNRILRVESGSEGLLYINGQFCGPLDREGQAFPAGNDAEIHIQLFPYGASRMPLSACMELRGGGITRLFPVDCAYALIWPDGIIQLELRLPDAQEETAPSESVAAGVLLRYLSMRLADDPQATALLMNPQTEMSLPPLEGYSAAVPLRFAPLHASTKYDDRAGLLRRTAENVACVDAVLAITSPAGQGRRLIEKIEIIKI